MRKFNVRKMYLEQRLECYAHEAAHVILSAPDEYPPYRPRILHNGRRTLMSDQFEGVQLAPHSREGVQALLGALASAPAR